ncbi:hypothetical protein E3983_01185 [Legionella israelensis]|uniref:Sodium/calcium exchanger membrane region domain-containing protein n=3 Tax=Legionella israelensis TaxID=454 RepID=A0AAX1EDA3_9GAMM|nr:hypothetical protein [Legionella israelensis]QBR83091.1 hypothetical protein E3983_01185 [Legionella israelensis]
MSEIITYFQQLPLYISVSVFFGLTIVIWIAGTFLVYLVDAIADKTKIAKAFLGFVLLAVITELPEVVTTMTAAASNNAQLALNNMFGGISLQMTLLVLADILIAQKTLTSFPRKPTPVIEGLFLIIMLTILLVFYFIGDFSFISHVGFASVFMAFLYLSSVFITKRFTTSETWRPFEMPESSKGKAKKSPSNYMKLSLKKLFMYISLSALVILIFGLLITLIAEAIAVKSGLGTSFIGVTMLALVTSLPELSTVIAAVRIKSYTLAISNILGSNLIMVFLILPADLMFSQGLIINSIDTTAALALLSGIIITAIYCIGLLFRGTKRLLRMGIDSILVLVFYILSLTLFYHFR